MVLQCGFCQILNHVPAQLAVLGQFELFARLTTWNKGSLFLCVAEAASYHYTFRIISSEFVLRKLLESL